MRAPQQNATSNGLAGWDIGLAAFALACMTAGFWRLLPGAVSLDEAPITAIILKAGLASLGFVGIATQWESVMKAWARNPLMLVLLALACSSPIWAITPAEALRNAIMLVVICVFGIALTLRFKAREFAEIAAFAGLFGLMAQFGAHKAMPVVGAYDGDIAFAIMGTAWAAWCVPVRRSMWVLALGICCALGFAAGDGASIGAVAGLVVGLGIAQIGAMRGRQKAVSVILTAWVIVALIIAVTLFALFGAQPLTAKITTFFEQLGPQGVIGQGFGLAGGSVASSLGAGLGGVGIAMAGLVAFATLFQVLLGERQRIKGLDMNVVVWFACLGAIVYAPGDIAMFGPVCILFAGTSFAISLSCVHAPQKRKPLLHSIGAPRPRQNTRSKPVPTPVRTSPVTSSMTPPLNNFGLRPKL
jgi:hypothetical protein